ncbi:nucleotide exchange factor GrpE [Ruminiclostridium cellobioparum]|jgi:molecular chaperone GrpE|uniref:nucleotide exchange factor GrpE n=1 Tax=Ruminiclostridium cellobioparum TaxID=29355 RepID=UPI0028A8BBAE|nr:nucleotide exchange factor GrpE [Ruminiclostridium cellobioparum]
MKKDKNSKAANDEVNMVEENDTAVNAEVGAEGNGEETNEANKEIEELKNKLEEKTRQCEEYMNMVQRTAAEFDNYKKRTIKEKEALSLDAAIDTVNAFLPVVDNLERALKAVQEVDDNPMKEGVELVMRQLKDCLEKMGVEPIAAVNNPFDPELHNAVMHVDDDAFGDSVVIEEFQKGYTMKGKVVRHSVVKVAN